jgi:hypothetical protein
VKDSHARIQINKELLAELQPALELKVARKAALEAELKNLTAEIEADKKKMAEIPGLTEKIKRKLQQPLLNQVNSRQCSPLCPMPRKLIRNCWRTLAR